VNSIFDHVDPQVIFVVVALVIAGLQAMLERRKKLRAEREAAAELRRRAAERGAAGTPPLPEASFEDLYEEYRRQILTEQQRPPGQPETYRSPWEPAPAPPPLPPATPPPLPAIELQPPPPPKPVTSAAAWSPPKICRAEEILTPAERAALAEVQRQGRARHRRKQAAATSLPARKLLRGGRAGLRTAVILREVLGPPKGDC
jgi:hypothetical protein